MEELLNFRKSKIINYSQYNFLKRRLSDDIFFKEFIKNDINNLLNDKDVIVYKIMVSNEKYLFIKKYLKWDSSFFNYPIFELKHILFKCHNFKNLFKAIQIFIKNYVKNNYVFINIPSEDNIVIQALGQNGFKLIETRLNYYYPMESNFSSKERYKVRPATIEDIPSLKKVAYEMRNEFDRYHSDIFFLNSVADEYLSKFAEESVKGFADLVFVPAEDNVPTEAFLTAKLNLKVMNFKISKLVLAAVSSKTCKGWFVKLTTEFLHYFREIQSDYVVTTTQSTNKAAIYNWEKHGFKLSSVKNIMAIHNYD